jgi:TolA-binding protein
MKNIVLFLLLCPLFVWGQKFETAKAGDKLKLDASETYLVQRDTSASGVITLTLTPTAAMKPELESKLGSVLGRIAEIDAQLQTLQDEKKGQRQQQKELEALLAKLSSPGKTVTGPKQ